jgi:hypothetical protein
MYLQDVTNIPFTTTLVKIKYDCCGKEHVFKWKDAKTNFEKNNGKHICRPCGLKLNNPAKRSDVQEKIKKTNLEKYGTAMPMNSKQNTEARVEKMFGSEEAKQKIVEKRKSTSIQRYGAEHIMKTEEGLQKVKDAMQERYGVDHPLQSEEIKEKMRQTCQERYGVDNVGKVPEIRVKMAETTLEKYGVPHYNQLPDMKQYLRENCRDWLKESWANPWAKGTIRPEDWNKKQSQTMAQKIIRGEFSPEDPRFFYTGWYKSDKCKKQRAFYRSSLELMMHYIIDTDKKVLWYENEPFAISYEKSQGIYRNYIPDFFVYMKEGCPKLYEIKPSFKKREESVQYKIDAALKFCDENNFEFVYVDENFLKNQNIDLQFLLNLPQVETLKK